LKLISRASAFLALCGLLSATSTAQTPAVFHPGDKLAAGGSPWKTAVGDVDGNETPDLVVARGGSVSVLLNSDPVLLNSATAAFEGPTTSIAAGLSPNAVAIGKLNADGFGDLVTVNLDGTISVLLGTGTGSFEAPTAAGAITNPLTMALADLNGDSFSDLVRPQSWSKTVLVQFGDGSGGFEPGVLWLYAMPSSPQSVAIGDVNGDSNPDLVTALDEWDVLVMLGGGTGLDVFQLGSKTYAVGAAPAAGYNPAIGDLNNDGLPDLIVPVEGGPDASVSVLLGTGAGAFGAGTITTFPGIATGHIKLGDLNRDGYSDLVLEDDTLGTVNIALGTGTGSFGVPSTVGATRAPVTVADLNLDSKLDLVTATTSSPTVFVLLNANADTAGIPWTYLGHGLAGTGGQVPRLWAHGPLTGFSEDFIVLDQAMPNSLAYVFVGLDPDCLPFKGGVMVPAPTVRVGPFALDGQGGLILAFTWQWPGLKLCTQAWILDAGAPMGLSATNGLQLSGQ
jgi:hypothetical protein